MRCSGTANPCNSRLKRSLVFQCRCSLTGLFHEAASFSSGGASLCLTEHVGLVPPPIFQDVCLFLSNCWPTSQNKTSFLKGSPPTQPLLRFKLSSTPRIFVCLAPRSAGWCLLETQLCGSEKAVGVLSWRLSTL